MVQNPINTADPRNRKLIIELYEERGEEYIRERFGVTRFAIARWRELERQYGSLAPHYQERGRHAALSPKEVKVMERALLKDPLLTNRDLAALVQNKVSSQVAGEYIRNSELRFVTKLEQLDVETAFTQRHVEEGREFHKNLRTIPVGNRYYLDETWIGAGVRRRKGRYPSGTAAWTPRNRKYQRRTVIGTVNRDGWIGPSRILDKGSMTTGEFEHYVEHDLAPRLHAGDVVIWDLLGKSGRSKNPIAHHFSPRAVAAIKARRARVLYLPPAGKLWNPIEIVFSETKRLFEKEVRKLTQDRMPSKLTFAELSAAWHKAERAVSADTFEHAFTERAGGQEFPLGTRRIKIWYPRVFVGEVS
jgi:transposase